MSQPDTRVAILPYGRKLGVQPSRIPLRDLLWPLGEPAGIAGGCLGDLTADDHLIVFPRSHLHVRPSFGTRAGVSLLLTEPRAIHARQMRLLRVTYRRFHRVLTSDETLLSRLPNAVFFPFGSTWVPEWRELDTRKTAMCSLIASAKRSQPGHVLRHEIAGWARDAGVPVDVMGRGYRPIARKSDGLAPYRFSVVIENVRERNYFTEKLIDALLCRTVPIYWGCPNIGDFLDTRAMIICENAAEIRQAVNRMSQDVYLSHLPALDSVRPRADDYGDLYARAARAVRDAG